MPVNKCFSKILPNGTALPAGFCLTADGVTIINEGSGSTIGSANNLDEFYTRVGLPNTASGGDRKVAVPEALPTLPASPIASQTSDISAPSSDVVERVNTNSINQINAQKPKKDLSSFLSNKLGVIGGGLNLLGSLISSTASNANIADPGLGAAGGALQGAFGGSNRSLGSRIFGGVAGAARGALQTSSKIINRNLNNRRSSLAEILSNTNGSSSLFIGEEGGIVLEEGIDPQLQPDVYVAAQLDKGETNIDFDGGIYDSHSKLMHEDMSPKDITDFLRANSYVLPDRDELGDDDLNRLVGYSLGNYEEGRGNFTVEEMMLKDFIGDKHITLAEASKRIRNKYKVVDTSHSESPLDKKTNIENLKNREEPISKLIQINEERLGNAEKPKEAPIKNVVHMRTGGGIPFSPQLIELLRSLNGQVDVGALGQDLFSNVSDFQGAQQPGTQQQFDDQLFNPDVVNPQLSTAAQSNQPQQAAPTDLNTVLNDSFQESFDTLDNSILDADKLFKKDIESVNDSFRSVGNSQGFELAATLAGIGLQDTGNELFQKISNPAGQFQKISPFETEANIGNVIGQAIALQQTLNDSPAGANARILSGDVISRTLQTAGQISSRDAAFNANQETARLKEANDVLNTNRAAIAANNNIITGNENKTIANTFKSLNQFSNANSKLRIQNEQEIRKLETEKNARQERAIGLKRKLRLQLAQNQISLSQYEDQVRQTDEALAESIRQFEAAQQRKREELEAGLDRARNNR